jgi:hypothetical protein
MGKQAFLDYIAAEKQRLEAVIQEREQEVENGSADADDIEFLLECRTRIETLDRCDCCCRPLDMRASSHWLCAEGDRLVRENIMGLIRRTNRNPSDAAAEKQLRDYTVRRNQVRNCYRALVRGMMSNADMDSAFNSVDETEDPQEGERSHPRPTGDKTS